MRAIGRMLWVVPGGHIPLKSHGREPECTSHDQLCLLNTGEQDAGVKLTIFYSDSDPKGPYLLTAPAGRTRHVRFNDLIDPEAIPLDTDFAALVESNLPIVVQFSRLDTRQSALAICSTIAFAATPETSGNQQPLPDYGKRE